MKLAVLLALASQVAATPLFEAVERHSSSKIPDGLYKGSKTFLGETISAKLDIWNSTHFELILDDAIKVDCVEEYSYNKLEMTVPAAKHSGDCVHDALAKNKADLDSVVFDTKANKVTVTVKVSHKIPVSIVLSHSGASKHAAASSSASRLTLEQLWAERYVVYKSSSPKGNYLGDMTMLGEEVKASIDILSSSSLTFTISGVIDLNCTEPYSYKSEKITFTDIDKDGDCAHDAMAANKVTLDKVEYDTKKDTVTVTIDYKSVPLKMELKHKGETRMLVALAAVEGEAEMAVTQG